MSKNHLKFQLTTSEDLPSVICRSCQNEVSNCNRIKLKLIENQEKLLEMLSEELNVESFVEVKEEKAGYLNENYVSNENEEDLSMEYLESEDFEEENILIEVEEVPAQSKPEKSDTEICQDCGKMVKRKMYKRHCERVHLKICRYFCDLCDFKNYSRDKLLNHIKSHLNSKDIKCPDCNRLFNTRNAMRSHRDIFHLKKYEKVCHYCSRKFKTTRLFNDHVRKHHEFSERFQCDFEGCEKAYPTKSQVYRHKRLHHSDPVTCSSCSKSFNSQFSLSIHMRRHDAKFICDKCNRKFPCNFTLQQHLKTHSEIRTYICPHCQSGFYRPGTLTNHIRVVHMSVKYCCLVDSCSATLSGKAGLRRHIQRNHKDVGDVELQRLMQEIRNIPNPAPILDSNELPVIDENSKKLNKNSKRNK